MFCKAMSLRSTKLDEKFSNMAFDSKARLAGSAGTSVLRNRFSAGLEYQIALLALYFVQNNQITPWIQITFHFLLEKHP